jgi:hypothetical protein
VTVPAVTVGNPAIAVTLPTVTSNNVTFAVTQRTVGTPAATYISAFSQPSSFSELGTQEGDNSVQNRRNRESRTASFKVEGVPSRVFPGLGLRRVQIE